MKSLQESLFDDDLVTKEITFGNFFKWQKDEFTQNYFKETFTVQWSKYLSSVRIKKDSKVSGSTSNEIIYEGLLKLIENIKFDEDNITTDLFEDYLTKMMKPYYQYSLSDKYKRASVQIYKNGRFIIGQEQDMIHGDFDTIKVFPCQTLCLVFERK